MEIRWKIRNIGDRAQYVFMTLDNTSNIITQPVDTPALGPGGIHELITTMAIDLAPGFYNLDVSIGNTMIADSVNFTVTSTPSVSD